MKIHVGREAEDEIDVKDKVKVNSGVRSRSWPRSRTRLGVVVKGKVGAKVRVKTGLWLKIKN